MNFTLLLLLMIGCVTCSLYQYLTKNKGKYFFFIIAVLCILLILKNDWDTIPDINAYLTNFDNIYLDSPLLNVKPNYFGFESGFMTLTLIIKKIFYNKGFYLCVIFLIDYLCIYWAGKILFDSKRENSNKQVDSQIEIPYYPALFLSLWMGYFGMFYGVAVLRAGLATSIAFLGLALLYKHSYIFSIILFAVAFFLQSFSVIVILIVIVGYLFINLKKKNTYYIWLIICVLLWLSRISLELVSAINSLSGVLARYISRFTKIGLFYSETAGNGFWSKKNMMFLVLAWLFIYCKPEKDKDYDKLLNVYMVGLTITYLTNEIVVGYRLSDMFFIVSLPLSYYLVVNRTRFDLRSRIILMIMLIVIPFIISARIIGIS